MSHGICGESSLSSGSPWLGLRGENLKNGAPRWLENANFSLLLARLNKKSESNFGPSLAKSTLKVSFLLRQTKSNIKKSKFSQFFHL